MPNEINYMLIIVLMAGIACEVYFILKRKGIILIKGKDDFFVFSIAMLCIVLIFPLSENSNSLEMIRNCLLLVLVMGSVGVKRGLSEQGMVKVCYTVPWENIQEVYVNEYQTTKIQIVAKTTWGTQKLIFPKHNLKDLLRIIEKKISKIYIQPSLESAL